MKQLREIWQENARLQQMRAERDREIDAMKRTAEEMAGAQARREHARFAMGRDLSRRKQRLNRLLISATASCSITVALDE